MPTEPLTAAKTASRIRQTLTDAVHREPAKYDLLRGQKTAIEVLIAGCLSSPRQTQSGTSRARASLEHLARFCAANRGASSAVLIRDMLAGIHGGGTGTAHVSRLTRLDDDNAQALTYVLTALLSPADADERLYDQDLLQAFKRAGAEDFFFAESQKP